MAVSVCACLTKQLCDPRLRQHMSKTMVYTEYVPMSAATLPRSAISSRDTLLSSSRSVCSSLYTVNTSTCHCSLLNHILLHVSTEHSKTTTSYNQLKSVEGATCLTFKHSSFHAKWPWSNVYQGTLHGCCHSMQCTYTKVVETGQSFQPTMLFAISNTNTLKR